MKSFFTGLFMLAAITGWSKQDSVADNTHGISPAYSQKTIIATISVGIIDDYRTNYTLPAGFQKSNTSGFAPFYGKIEYALYKHISLAAAFGYDAFVYNYKQNYTGNNGPFTRYKVNKARIFSGGITAFYHLDQFIHVSRLDPFIGVGLSLNNIRYSAHPQGDSTVVKIDHTVTPYLKAGARYYISDKFSLFGDVGYDKQSIISLGFSCRFFSKSMRGKDVPNVVEVK